jgi:hypothetical protein
MKSKRNSGCRIVGLGALLFGTVWSAQASLVEVKFATQGVVNANPGNAAWVSALAHLGSLGVTPGGITGRLYYESTTPGNIGTPEQRNYNGAIDSLQFSVAGWFSQSLTNIGNNGDIRIQNNATMQTDQDGIRSQVVCSPVIGMGTACASQTYNFNYSFVDAAGVTWALDQFTLLLQESGAAEPLDSVDLPTKEQWESSAWTVRRIDLRFNPSDAALNNGNARGALSFLAVPEPGTIALLGLGLLGLGIVHRKR